MGEPATAGGASDRDDDARWLREAIALAVRARPSPNPRVGCVLVRDGVLVGAGFHRAAGQPHAEAEALRDAGERARGATAYVTLEPCNHYGRTPPCTDALIAAGVRRVVLGVEDPNPHVAGGGVARLREAGLEVTRGVEPEACEALVRAWRHAIVHGSPRVTLKAGMSLDGRIASRDGVSQWITGPLARADAHRARAEADAVLVGVGTVLADDPLLTVRDAPLLGAPPLRVVLDTHLRTPPASKLAGSLAQGPVLLVHGPAATGTDRAQALAARGLTLAAVALDARSGRVDLAAALAALYERGVVDVLVEGGSAVHGALLDAGHAHALRCYVAPLLLGGARSLPAFGGEGFASPSAAPRLRAVRYEALGEDLRVTAEIDHVHRDHHGSR